MAGYADVFRCWMGKHLFVLLCVFGLAGCGPLVSEEKGCITNSDAGQWTLILDEDFEDQGKTPEGKLLWTPLTGGGWTGLRNFRVSWVDVDFFKVYRRKRVNEKAQTRGKGTVVLSDSFVSGG